MGHLDVLFDDAIYTEDPTASMYSCMADADPQRDVEEGHRRHDEKLDEEGRGCLIEQREA